MSDSPTASGSRTSTPDVPDHELLRCIGRGSYGEVWLARNVTGMYRAVKVVSRDRFESERPFEREFKGIQKFEPISRTHESQVDILHVGRQNGYFYYVMELADDAREPDRSAPDRAFDPEAYTPRTLHALLQGGGRLPLDVCLEIALALTTALRHLHRHGLVHRDVKPSNIIFVNGIPKLADIGLVTDTAGTLSFVGTEGYLPPEGPGKPSADLYSLGKVIYEMCSGRDRLDYPELPTYLRSEQDRQRYGELNEVILKACEPDSKRRYASAEQMQRDLLALQSGKSLRRKRAINRTARGLFKVAALLTILGLFGYLAGEAFRPTPSGTEIFSPPATVPVSFQLADMGAHFAHRRFDIAPDGRRILYANSDGKLFLSEHGVAEPMLDTLTQEWACNRLGSPPAWAPDGKAFAISGYRRELLTPDKHVRQLRHRIFIGDPDTGEASPLPGGLIGTISALLWRTDKTGLTVKVHTEQSADIFDIARDGTLQPWPPSETQKYVNGASGYSPNGRWLCGGDGNDIWLIEPGGSQSVRLTFHPYPEIHPAWGDDETIYFVRYESPNFDQRARLMLIKIDPETGAPTGESVPLPIFRWSQILYPKVVDDGKRLLFIEQESVNSIEVCSYPDEANVRRLARGDSPRLSSDGSEVYYIDRTPRREGIYALSTSGNGEARQVVRTAGVRNGGFDLSPDGRRLVYARPDASFQAVVEVAVMDRLETYPVWSRPIRSSLDHAFFPRWSPQANLIAIITGQRQASLVDVTSGAVRQELELPGNCEYGPLWSPSGDYLAFILSHEIQSSEVSTNAPQSLYHVNVYSLSDETWKRLPQDAQTRYIEMFCWRPGSVRGELTYFTYLYPNCHRSVYLDSNEINYLLPIRPVPEPSSPGELDFWGVWAPDGRRFYFSSTDHNGRDVHVFHADTAQVDHEAVPDGLPFWSGAGSTMGWVDTERRAEFKVMDLR